MFEISTRVARVEVAGRALPVAVCRWTCSSRR